MKNNNFTLTRVACYTGYFVQAIINNLAALFYVIFQNRFNLSYSQISWLILINFVTQIVVDLSSVIIIRKIGYRKSVVSANILSCAGLVFLGIVPKISCFPYVSLITAVIIYACGSGMIEVLISPIIESLPFKNKSGEMSLLHSFYCWGQAAVVLFTTLFLNFFGSDNWNAAPVLWAAVPFVNTFLFIKAPIITPGGDNSDALSARQLFSDKLFIKTAVIMLCSGASEIAMSQWASAFAEKSLGVSKSTGDLLGPCMFAFLMAVGRIIFGVVGDRVRSDKVLCLGSFVCILSYLIVTLAENPYFSLAGCALCGFSVSVMWPGTFSMASKQFPNGGTLLFAMLAMFGDFGCAFGPWLAGMICDSFEKSVRVDFDPLSGGLLVCTVFPVLMLLLTLIGIIKKDNKELLSFTEGD